MKKASLLTATLILMCMTIDHSSREVSAVNEATKNTFRFLFNFYQKPVASLIKNSSATEDHEEKSPELKKGTTLPHPLLNRHLKPPPLTFQLTATWPMSCYSCSERREF